MKSLYDEFVAIVSDDVEDESSDIHLLERKSLMYSNDTTTTFSSSALNDHYEDNAIGLFAVRTLALLVLVVCH